MRSARRFAILVGALFALATAAPAYYYWIFFQAADGSGGPIPARYDLSALPQHAIQYFISDQGPSTLAVGDTQTGLFSQIQQAAKVWNGVASSGIRLQFGGPATIGTLQATPGIDVVFNDDMPPGILAQTIPTFPANLKLADGQTFVPILRAKVQLRSDLASAQQASFSDFFFLTLVHEFGHALGLQHTLTSGVMSTAITRATMKGSPLSADDIAGISQLYPASTFPAATGSISGRVLLGATGAGINLASVVALSTQGVAISGMSNPDGSYRIDGLPAGSYYVYAHPLPPALGGEAFPANIIPPADPAGDNFAAQIAFGTLFYPGTTDWTQAVQVAVVAKTTTPKIDFVAAARPGPALHSMEVYGYENNVPVASPPLPAKTRNTLVFHAYGATVNKDTQMAPGLAVSVIGNAASVESGSLSYYSQGFLLFTTDTGDLAASTPTALAATLNGDLYVLPAAFTVVPGAPPAISSITQSTDSQGNLIATLSGTGLTLSSQIQVDGVRAQLQAANLDGSFAFVVPQAPSAHVATIEAVNPDGQTSLQALAAGSTARPLYSYPLHDPPSAAISPNSGNAGQDLWVAVNGTNTHFADGQTQVGFGTSDVYALRTWVAGPGLMFLNIRIGAAVPAGPVSLNVTTGLETIHMANVFTVLPAPTGQVTIQLPVTDATTGLAAVPPGGSAVIATSGLNAAQIANPAAWSLSIAGEAAPFQVDKNGTLTAQVPADLTTGPKVVQLTVPGAPPLAPVIAQLSSPPPIILAAGSLGYQIATPATPVHPGDSILLWIYRLSDNSGAIPPVGDVWFSLGPVADGDTSHAGIRYPASGYLPPSPDTPTLRVVQFTIPSDVLAPLPAGTVAAKLPMRLGTSERLSATFLLDIAVAPPAQ